MNRTVAVAFRSIIEISNNRACDSAETFISKLTIKRSSHRKDFALIEVILDLSLKIRLSLFTCCFFIAILRIIFFGNKIAATK